MQRYNLELKIYSNALLQILLRSYYHAKSGFLLADLHTVLIL